MKQDLKLRWKEDKKILKKYFLSQIWETLKISYF